MRIAVCDDSQEYRGHFVSLLRQVTSVDDSVKAYSDGVDLLDSCKAGYPHDLTFLDIKMPYMDGMTVAERIRELAPDTVIVVVTRFSEHAVEFYDYNAYRYLIKPVSATKLKKVLEDVRAALHNKRFIMPKTKEGYVKQPVSYICYFAVKGRKITAFTMGGELAFYGSLKNLRDELEGESFYQIHQSYIVSLYYVKRAVKYRAFMEGDETLPIAETRYAGFMKALMKYISAGGTGKCY